MFGKNEIIGKKYFDNAGDQLYITSMFYTLQGEGPYRGEPAFFIRLSKCNLACSFCDTYFDSGDWLTIDQILEKIDQTISDHFNGDVPYWAQYINESSEHFEKKREMVLVLTGGEPMLQKNIVPFLSTMNKFFKRTQIESNGIVNQDIPRTTTLVVSPKCLEKNGRAVKYLEPNSEVLNRADCLKFVMEANENSPYNTIPQWAHTWHNDTKKPIFVSPMNIYNNEPQKAKQLRTQKNDISIEERSTVDEVISFWEEGLLDMKSNQLNHEYAAKYCAQHGYILNLQLHLYASLA
jgi:organic radical activating enzyme